MIRTRRTPGRVINHSSARGRRTDQDLPSVPAMNRSRPGREATAVDLSVPQGQGLTVQEDRVLMVRQSQGPTVQQVLVPTVRVQARRTPAPAPTAHRRVPALMDQRQDHMVREVQDRMVLPRVSSVPPVQLLRRALAPDQVSSVR